MKPTLSLISDARRNDHDGLISGIKFLYNCVDVIVDRRGKVWIEGPMRGHWLDKDGRMRIARALAHGDI